MERSRIIEIVVLGLWLLIVLVLILRSKEPTQFVPNSYEESEKLVSKKYDVRKITVIDGNTFDLSLSDDLTGGISRVLGEIPVKAISESKRKVVELLNRVQNPRVKLSKRMGDGRWIIEMTFSLDGKDVEFLSWMKENNLIYN